jgi:ribose transport system substrate-binding protein
MKIQARLLSDPNVEKASRFPCRHLLQFCACAAIFCLFAFPACGQGHPGKTSADDAAFQAQARQVVAEASSRAVHWTGPQSGPVAPAGKNIAFMAEDLRNGGVLGVAQGMREATNILGWRLHVFDAHGTAAGRAKALSDALASRPDGLIVAGSDAVENKTALQPFADRRIPVVAWHAGSKPGPIAGTPVAMNITTDPLAVARVTAMAAVVQSGGHAGVVILTDSRFGIAMAKANAMAEVIRRCKGCTLHEIRDVAISDSSEKMPAVTQEMLQRYGKRWTHLLAINDIYFDYAVPMLTKAGVPSNGLSLLSAGDGSTPAFLRIHAGTYQTGTVAEPLNLQGWQLVDELNRLFAGQPVSGFVAPVHLVNAGNVAFDGGTRFQYDPDNAYRDIYRRIWKQHP